MLLRHCVPDKLIPTIREALTLLENAGRVPAKWEVGREFMVAWINQGVTIANVIVDPRPIDFAASMVETFTPATICGIPSINSERLHGIAMLKDAQGSTLAMISCFYPGAFPSETDRPKEQPSWDSLLKESEDQKLRL